MELYRLIKKLESSKDLNKEIAFKYDAGKIKSEKYGEATISGHFLLTTRHGKFPPMHVKPIEEKAYIWLNEMGLEELRDYAINFLQLPSILAYTAPGVDPEKLDLFFKFALFLFLFDDAVLKLNHSNKDNSIKQRKDLLSLAENLISIIESHGNDEATETAASKLNPMFKSTCTVLSNVFRSSFKRMCNDNYMQFSTDTVDFIRVNKWMQEYDNSPYSENEYYLLRRIDGGVIGSIFLISLAKGIRISNEIRTHPIFRRYYDNVAMHVALTNDILSLEKEAAANEKLNLVLINCQKYSLQQSIYKAEKAANELMINLKKDASRLKLYFPTNDDLKNFIETAEYILDGFLLWHQSSVRYGNLKFETYVVEYNCDYNRWLEQVGIFDVENVKEPILSYKLLNRI